MVTNPLSPYTHILNKQNESGIELIQNEKSDIVTTLVPSSHNPKYYMQK